MGRRKRRKKKEQLDGDCLKILNFLAKDWLRESGLMSKLAARGLTEEKAVELVTQLIINRVLVVEMQEDGSDGFYYKVRMTDKFQKQNPDLLEHFKMLEASKQN